jgi:hypothetical protein
MLSDAPSTIPVWTLNGVSTRWDEVSVATREGERYCFTIRTLGSINCDLFWFYATLRGRVCVDGKPAVGVSVHIGQMIATTGSDGSYAALVTSGQPLTISTDLGQVSTGPLFSGSLEYAPDIGECGGAGGGGTGGSGGTGGTGGDAGPDCAAAELECFSSTSTVSADLQSALDACGDTSTQCVNSCTSSGGDAAACMCQCCTSTLSVCSVEAYAQTRGQCVEQRGAQACPIDGGNCGGQTTMGEFVACMRTNAMDCTAMCSQ